MGAIAMGGVRVLNEEVLRALRLPPTVIDAVAEREQRELERRARLYRGTRPPLEVGGKTILSNELQPKLAGFFSKSRKPSQDELDDEPWELTFAPQPARVKFDGNLARLTFYFTGFKSEKGEFPGLQVTSAYRLARETPNVKLVREEIDVLPIDYSEENPAPLSGRPGP